MITQATFLGQKQSSIYLGIFPTNSALPTGKANQYASVLSTGTYWYWNTSWIDSGIDLEVNTPQWVSNLGIDTTDATYYYFWYTQVGTTNWRIKRMAKSGYAITWASGTTAPSTNRTNRASLSYSVTI